MQIEEFPCKCGHMQSEHEENEDSPLCIGCSNDNRGWDIYWHKFKLDNLKYLEQLSKE
jgi:hypothetical protein